MVPLLSLWIPILISAVVVFIASSVIHMMLKYHRKDLTAIPQEEAVRGALRNAPPGQYVIPWCADMKEMQNEPMKKKLAEGPVAIVTIRSPGMIDMGPLLTQWLIYCVLISFFCAYVAHATVPVAAEYLTVFRVVGTVAWLGYAGATISAGIWQSRPWSTVAKDVFDGLIYALLTAGVFGWLWPR
jgi:hypothetical protein